MSKGIWRVICLLKGICQKEGNTFVKRRVIYLLKRYLSKGGGGGGGGYMFVKRYLSKGGEYICQKEGNIFVKRYLSKGG